MVELQYLTVKKRFTFREYLHMFRQLFPKCTAWNWLVTYIDVLQPPGISSGEGFGYPRIINEQILQPVGIPTAGAFGNLLLQLVLSPSAIGSGEAFGTATVANNYGFYLYDDFEDGSIKSAWNSAFASTPADWTVRTQEGQKIAYSPNANICQLFPQSTAKISGYFEVKWQYVIGTNSGGNTSLHIEIQDPADGHIHGNFIYVPTEFQFKDEATAKGVQTGMTAPRTVTCKMVRSSGVIWAYYNDDATGGEAGSWIRNDAWSTPGSSVSFSADCVLLIDGDDSYGGYGFIEVKGDALV